MEKNSSTKVASKQEKLTDLVEEEEEMEKNSFTAPTVVSLEVVQERDEDQGQFIFGAPHNESTISEKESEGEMVPDVISGADAELEIVDKKAEERGFAESKEDEDEGASENVEATRW